MAEELGRGLADVPFVGPILAAELRRLAGSTRVHRTGDRRSLGPRASAPVAVGGMSPAGALAVDATGRGSRAALVPAGSGYRLARVPLTAPRRCTLI